MVGTDGTILKYELPPTTTTSIITTTTTSKPSFCPVNTVYGEKSEEANLLRLFRDEVLKKTVEGRELIRLYYDWSPLIVAAIAEDEKFKEEVRELLDEVLLFIKGE